MVDAALFFALEAVGIGIVECARFLLADSRAACQSHRKRNAVDGHVFVSKCGWSAS